MNLQIIDTEDGSKTLYSSELQENYHSTHGAITESEHVYIKHGLQRRLTLPFSGPLSLLEVGFGTGLNCLLSVLNQQHSEKPYQLLYHTYEIHPLPLELIAELYQPTLSENNWNIMESIHLSAWDQPTEIAPGFTLLKVHKDLTTSEIPSHIDVIYMDAFAPEVTAELWSETFLSKLARSADKNCILSTYCAKGLIRRTLEQLGFEVDRLPGPPNGKREIISCVRQ